MTTAELQGPMEIELTLKVGIDKQGRVTVDWDAAATVPKGMTPPRVDQYMAKTILEVVEAAMDLKGQLNWSVKPVQTEPDGTAEDPSDALP